MRLALRKLLVLGFTLAIGLVVLGVFYQKLGQARDFERYPPPGDLINVNGVQLHLHCAGSGGPTVVVEAGHGNSSVEWTDIQEAASAFARICLYDRAGLGWSAFDASAPTREHVAVTLRELLQNANIDPPFVLVGHSLGGVYAREFERRFSDDVVGLVLVDSSHADQYSRAGLRPTQDPLALQLALCRLLAPLGIVRASGVMNRYLSPETPREIRPFLLATMNRTRFCSATRLARDTLVAELSRGESIGLQRDLPVIVLTRTRPDNPDGSAESAAWETLWAELQSELARLSSDSDQRIVEGAGHFIQHDQPEAVIGAIRELVETAR